MGHQYSIFSVFIYLPLFFIAPLFGLLPLVTGPIFVFLISIITVLKSLDSRFRGNDDIKNFVPLNLFIFLLASYLLGVSWQSDSYVFERSLTLASAFLYGYILISSNEKTLLKFALISSSWLLSILFLSTSLIKSLHPIYIALANSNALALQLAMVIPITLKECLSCKNKQKLLLGFFTAILTTQLIALFLTKAQAVWAVLISSGVLTLEINPRKKWLFACVLAVSFLAYKLFLDPIAISDRWQWAKVAFSIFKDHPLLGASHEGGFLRLHSIHQEAINASQLTILAHNLYLEWLADFGFIGSGLLLIAIYNLKRRLAFSSWALKCSTGVFLLSGLFDSSHLFLPNIVSFLGICALAGKKEAPQGLSPALYLLLLSIVITQSFRLSIGRAYLFFAELKLSQEAINTKELNEAHQQILKSLRWDKKNPYTWVDLMKIELLKHDFQNALKAIEQASRIDPHNKIYLRNIAIIKNLL